MALVCGPVTSTVNLKQLLDDTFGGTECGHINVAALQRFLRALIDDGGVGSSTIPSEISEMSETPPTQESSSDLHSKTTDGKEETENETEATGDFALSFGESSRKSSDPYSPGPTSPGYDQSQTSVTISSLDGDRTPEATVPSTTEEFLDMLRGCRRHLEILKQEVLNLQTLQSETDTRLDTLTTRVDSLEEGMCAMQKVTVQLQSDINCLGIIITEYEAKFEQIFKDLDHNGIQHREMEWSLRSLAKERDGFLTAVRMVTEQINNLACMKADKAMVEEELHRRALDSDLETKVPYEIFNSSLADLCRCVALQRDDIYNLHEKLNKDRYEAGVVLARKANSDELRVLKKKVLDVISKLQHVQTQSQMDKEGWKKLSAGVTEQHCAVMHCMTCGNLAHLEGFSHPVPLATNVIPAGRPKFIYPVHTRSCGGPHTVKRAEEKIFRTISAGDIGKIRQTLLVTNVVGDMF